MNKFISEKSKIGQNTTFGHNVIIEDNVTIGDNVEIGHNIIIRENVIIGDFCKNLGADEPEYIVHGEDIMVKFSALQSAKMTDSKAPKPHNDALDDALEKRLLMVLKENPKIKQTDLVLALDSSRATVQRIMKALSDSGRTERKGGKRYGYWEVHE